MNGTYDTGTLEFNRRFFLVITLRYTCFQYSKAEKDRMLNKNPASISHLLGKLSRSSSSSWLVGVAKKIEGSFACFVDSNHFWSPNGFSWRRRRNSICLGATPFPKRPPNLYFLFFAAHFSLLEFPVFHFASGKPIFQGDERDTKVWSRFWVMTLFELPKACPGLI